MIEALAFAEKEHNRDIHKIIKNIVLKGNTLSASKVADVYDLLLSTNPGAKFSVSANNRF